MKRVRTKERIYEVHFYDFDFSTDDDSMFEKDQL